MSTTDTPTTAVRNGITINPPENFPYRAEFMQQFGHGLRPNYPLQAWELHLWQALWLMPKEQLEATAAAEEHLGELLGEDWGYVMYSQGQADIYSEEVGAALQLEAMSGFICTADLIARCYRPGDVTPEGTEARQEVVV